MQQFATPMQNTYSISDLAQEFGVTTRTIRFYEEKGLLNPQRDGSHRLYSAADRTKLRLILRGKRIGFSLDESAEIIGMYGSPGNNRRQLETLLGRIEEKRAELLIRRRELDAMLQEMEQAEHKCRSAMKQLKSSA
jgi:DNA-binding transcriptional MerR regulator